MNWTREGTNPERAVMAESRYSFWKQFIFKLWNMKFVAIVKIALLSKAVPIPRAIRFCGTLGLRDVL
jgi:hypothetical protein